MPDTPELREIELKYRVQNAAGMDRLRADTLRLAGHRLGPVSRQRTVDLYWDTADYALARSGFGLRIRRQDERWLVTLKELALTRTSALADRIEVECPLAESEVDAFLNSPKLGRLLTTLKRSRDLTKIWPRLVLRKENPRLHLLARVQQTRDKRSLLTRANGDSQDIAELSLDEVAIVAPSRRLPVSAQKPGAENLAQDSTGSHPVVEHFFEVEVEARPGAPAVVLEKLEQVLSRKRSFQPSAEGKAEAAMRIIARRTEDGEDAIQATTLMAEAGRAIWRQQLVEIVLSENVIRQDTDATVEGVHEMRVAIRRIRAAARIFGPYFDRETVRPFLGTVRDLAQALGAVRDLDVSLALVKEYQRALSGQGTALSTLRNLWEEERKAAYQTLDHRLGNKAHGRFISEFARFCHTPGTGIAKIDSDSDSPSAQEVRHVLPAEIFGQYVTMRRYETVLDADTPPDIFHALRIEGKRLRYALEFVGHLLDPKAAAALIGKLKALQDCLGNMNDGEIMQDRVRHFAAGQVQTPSVVPILDYLDEQIARERDEFSRLWAEFNSPETRRQLALAIVKL